MAGNIPVQREAHPDVPLANLALQAFEAEGDYIATQLIPAVTVTNETDQFYVLDADSWLRIENTRRSRLVAPREVEWKVGSDNYVVKNYALANKIAFEDLANADRALALRENATRFVVQMLLRDQEDRIARLVTSGTNLGSYVSLSGVNKWSDYINSDPISDVNTAQAFIRGITGMTANVIALDYDTVKILQRHPVILDAAIGPGRTTGLATDQQLAALFGVERVLVGKAIKQNAVENATASYTNIWGNNAVLAHVEQGVGLQTATFGLRFVWQPENFPAPFQVFRSEDPIPGVNAEIILAGYFQDEKVVAKNLSYGILSTILPITRGYYGVGGAGETTRLALSSLRWIMQRIFTKDIGRFKAGEVRDYWKPTWTAIERSAKMALEKFSKPYEEAAQEGAKRK